MLTCRGDKSMNNQPSCTIGNPPTEADKDKIWVYWDGDTPHYIRADSIKDAWVEMIPRLSPMRWAEITNGETVMINKYWMRRVCWEGEWQCTRQCRCYDSWAKGCLHWRPDSWMEGE